MTDGVQSLEAMEYQSIPVLSTALRFGILIVIFAAILSVKTNVFLFMLLLLINAKANDSYNDVDVQDWQ